MAMTRKELHEYAATFYQFKMESNHLVMLDTIDRLHRLERQLTVLNETACNRDLTPAEASKMKHLADSVLNIAGNLGFRVRFNSDPRGGAIRFLLPSGKSNNWDGETWGFTSSQEVDMGQNRKGGAYVADAGKPRIPPASTVKLAGNTG